MFSVRQLPYLATFGRTVNNNFVQLAYYVNVKSPEIEAKLGLPERPKRPPTPYLKFVQQKYPEYAKTSPKISFKDVVQRCSEDWKVFDKETKESMLKEYHEKLSKYPDVLKKYYDSLTDGQRVQLEAAKQQRNLSKKKRRDQQERRKLGKPIKPVTSFGMFVAEEFSKNQSKHNFGPSHMKELSKTWKTMTPEEKAPYAQKYQEAYKTYEKKLAEWEEEMVRQGKESLVRSRSRPIAGTPKKSSLAKNVNTTSSEHATA